MEKVKSRAIKRVMKEVIKKVFMSEVSSVFCLSDPTPILTPSKASSEVSILVSADENGIVDEVENTAVETVENIVAPPVSHFVLPSFSAVDIDVSMDANLNTMKNDYCVREPVSPCFFVVLAFLVTDTSSSGPVESVISVSDIKALNLTTPLFYYFFFSFGEVRLAWMFNTTTTIRCLVNRRSRDSHKERPKVKIKAEALHQG